MSKVKAIWTPRAASCSQVALGLLALVGSKLTGDFVPFISAIEVRSWNTHLCQRVIFLDETIKNIPKGFSLLKKKSISPLTNMEDVEHWIWISHFDWLMATSHTCHHTLPSLLLHSLVSWLEIFSVASNIVSISSTLNESSTAIHV